MLKKTLIALATVSSIAVMLPAQARDWEQNHREVRHHQSPQTSVFLDLHSDRNHSWHHRYQGHQQYRHHENHYRENRHHENRHNHGAARGWGHQQHYYAQHHRNHH